MTRLPDCPSCCDNRAVHEVGDRNYRCTFCSIAFDGDADEGGSYSNNPVRGAIRREERQLQRRARR